MIGTKRTSFLSLLMLLICALFAAQPQTIAKNPWKATSDGTESQNAIRFQFFQSQYGKYIPYAKPKAWGGFAEYDPVTGAPKPGYVYGSWFETHTPIPLYTKYPPTPMSAFFNFPTDTKVEEGRYKHVMMPAMGDVLTDTEHQAHLTKIVHDTVANLTDPGRLTDVAMSTQQAQASSLGNAVGETARDQAASAIDFCSKYLFNFTADGANIWNRIRNELFVPIGLLILLPGAVLSQVRAIAAAGNPVLGEVNPFDGILRSVVAIFLIPGTYLIVNYGIDLSNSITLTIAGEYNRLFHSDMYKDAVCGEIRATPVRQPSENKDHYDVVTAGMGPMLGSDTSRGTFEGRMIETKSEDPCSNINKAPRDRVDEAVSSGVVATRLLSNSVNAGLTATWNILCAFMMAYLMYLFFVGPVVAGLWVWPMKQLRDALPNWIEGTLTLCFWSLFWNTVILLMACLKGVDETGSIMFSALNFLATASVKYAFDFAGLVKAAGQQAGQQAKSGAGGAGGAAGAGGQSGSAGKAASSAHVAGHGSGGAQGDEQGNSQPHHPQLPAFSYIRSGDGGPGESGDATMAGVPDTGTFNNASTVPGVGATPANPPPGTRPVTVDAGVPPLITPDNPERILLPNGDFLTLIRQADSSVVSVRDSSGQVIGTFDESASGNSYVRLMNGDMLQVARNGDGEDFTLHSNGTSQALRHGVFNGRSLVMPHLQGTGTANGDGSDGNSAPGATIQTQDVPVAAGATAGPNIPGISNGQNVPGVSNGQNVADVIGAGGASDGSLDPSMAVPANFVDQGGDTVIVPPGAASNSTLLAATAGGAGNLSNAHHMASSHPQVVIPTSHGPVILTAAHGHGTAITPGADGRPQTIDFDASHARTVTLSDGNIMSLSMIDGTSNIAITTPGGFLLSNATFDESTDVASTLVYDSSGAVIGTAATGTANANGYPVDTTVYRDSTGDVVGYYSLSHNGIQPGVFYDASGTVLNAHDHSQTTLHPVLAQAMDDYAALSSWTTGQSFYSLALDSQPDVAFTPLSAPLDPIVPAIPGVTPDIPLVASTAGQAVYTSDSSVNPGALTFARDAEPVLPPVIDAALPVNNHAPALGYLNNPQEIVQMHQSSSNLGVNEIVPTNWGNAQSSQPIYPTPNLVAGAQYAKLVPTSHHAPPQYGTDFFETALAAAALRRMRAAQRARESAEVTSNLTSATNKVDQLARSSQETPSQLPRGLTGSLEVAHQPPGRSRVDTGSRLAAILSTACPGNGQNRAQSKEAAMSLLGRLEASLDKPQS